MPALQEEGPRQVTVRTIPLPTEDGDQEKHWLDCSHCGPVLICPSQEARLHAADHLDSHGIDTTALREA